jgi:hypothetical protein
VYRVLQLVSLVSWCSEGYVMLTLVGYAMAIGSASKWVSVISVTKGRYTHVTNEDGETQHWHSYNYPSIECRACGSLGTDVSRVPVRGYVCLVRRQRVQTSQQCYLRCSNTSSGVVRCCMYYTCEYVLHTCVGWCFREAVIMLIAGMYSGGCCNAYNMRSGIVHQMWSVLDGLVDMCVNSM